VSTAGPFKVTSPNTAVSWAGGSTKTITWDVANTNVPPVNCTNVKLLYSTDGGKTFKVLKAATPNDGSEQITVPNVATTKARIAVLAVGNIFLDISDANFTITSSAIAQNGRTENMIADKKTTVSVVPNPAKDFFNITFNESTKNAALILTDANGKTVYSKNVSSISAGQTEKVSIQNFSKGYYFLKIKTDNGTQSEKIMVN
ncbi:MAG: T9SS type A sorting domain-containing protein, partial [Parafilimonas sp.]